MISGFFSFTPVAPLFFFFFFFNDTAPTEIYPLPLHDPLPISFQLPVAQAVTYFGDDTNNKIEEIMNFTVGMNWTRSEEHTSELQSLAYLVCRLLLEKKKIKSNAPSYAPIEVAVHVRVTTISSS